MPLGLVLSVTAVYIMLFTGWKGEEWYSPPLSLSQTLSGWQLIENRAMLLCHEGSLRAYWLDGRRSDPLASSA